MGINANRRGLVPDSDVAKFKAFGHAVKACYGKPVAATSEGSCSMLATTSSSSLAPIS